MESLSAHRATLSGRGAVVTGAGRGIGAAVARALAEAGAAVVVSARGSSQIEAVAEELKEAGAVAHPLRCDVTDAESVGELAARASELMDGVDILVNNAGMARSAPFLGVTLDQWETVHRVNATGPLLMTQALLPGMLERGWGRIVNVASVAGLSGARYITSYAASKHALMGLTRCLAEELSGTGVTVNAVCPGYVDTPMTDENIGRIASATGRDAKDIRTELTTRQPGGRLITTEEVAHAVMTFMPDAAAALQGSSLVIRGGGSAR